MRRPKILNSPCNCYMGDCQDCHYAGCMIYQGYRQEEYEEFTPEDYKNHIISLALTLLTNRPEGYLRKPDSQFDDDGGLAVWAIKHCRDENVLAEFAKQSRAEWSEKPYPAKLKYLIAKISNQSILGDLILWSGLNSDNEWLLLYAVDGLHNRDILAGLLKMDGKHIQYVERRLKELEEGYDRNAADNCEYPEADIPVTREELFETAKNYTNIDSAEKAVYRLADMSLLEKSQVDGQSAFRLTTTPSGTLLEELARGKW